MPVTLTGTFPAEDIRLMQVPRPPADLVAALAAIDGAVSTVSDVLDDMGVGGVVPGSRLKPVVAGRCIVGPALTLRKRALTPEEAADKSRRRGDIEAHNLTSPGDILVIEGLETVSNMGGLSARTSQRQGALGAVIWGGCRDVAEMRRMDYPVWSTGVTPVTGVGRVDGCEINGELHLGAVRVGCGDIIVADDDGVCVIPIAHLAEVVARVLKKAAADETRGARIKAGVPIADLAGRKPPQTPA